MKENYSATLVNGQEIYIPNWPVTVQLENLTQVGKVFGTNNVIEICTLNIKHFIVSLMSCEDHKLAAQLVRHFICQVRIDGSKIEGKTIDEMFTGDLALIAEIFCHLMHSQYHDFFVSGLAKATSPPSSSQVEKA